MSSTDWADTREERDHMYRAMDDLADEREEMRRDARWEE